MTTSAAILKLRAWVYTSVVPTCGGLYVSRTHPVQKLNVHAQMLESDGHLGRADAVVISCHGTILVMVLVASSPPASMQTYYPSGSAIHSQLMQPGGSYNIVPDRRKHQKTTVSFVSSKTYPILHLRRELQP